VAKTQLTILNSMASADFEESMRLHREWGLHWVDLRDAIYGRRVEELDLATATEAKRYIDYLGLEVHCLSTNVFVEEVARGESVFREHLQTLEKVMECCAVLRPRMVRLNAADFAQRSADVNSVRAIKDEYPWLVEVYQEGIDMVAAHGIVPTIENEAFDTSLSKPEEFVEFFQWLDRPDTAALTWDVQNQWSSGVFPSIEIYRQLKPFMRYYHVKGGQAEPGSTKLAWNVALEDASWPVLEITSAVVEDGVSPVICVNPPQHGAQKEGYTYDGIVTRDLDFLRASVRGLC
jgi:sugar phosphate isomerase/epimerase